MNPLEQEKQFDETLQKTNKMGTAPMLPLIVSMSLPAVFSMLVQALYNVVDSIFVGQYDPVNALAAVSLAFPVQALMISVAVGTGVGLNSLISRRLGEGRKDLASNAADHGILLGLCSWAVFALLGIFFTRPFYQMFSDNAALIEMATSYTQVVTIFSFGFLVEVNLEKALQATGNMIYPMFFMLTGAITNIVLDPIFIFGLFGVPRMGVTGAAIATVIGQICSMLVALYVVFFKKHTIDFSLKGFRPHWRTVKEIYRVGVPSIIMQSIGSVMAATINMILIQFNEAAVSVFGVYFKLQSFVFMPVFGLTHGVMPIMGYSYGSRNKKRLMEALRIGTIIAACIMALGTILFWAFTPQLLQIFNASAELLEIGIPALRIISLCFIPAAVGILFSTLFQALGMGIRSLIMSVMRQLVVLLPCAWWLARYGVNYVWMSFPIAEAVSLVVCIGLFVQLYRAHIRDME
ncbi:MAG: MATE family efflux transporter [Angelakisella sp.]|nr:MATE family efflux transporter [Angelakisella sp.]